MKNVGTIEYTVNLRRKDMNEWKELKVDNLPSDILVGDYEFEQQPKEIVDDQWTKKTVSAVVQRLLTEQNYWRYRYRKLEPKAPSHEEIMTKGWRLGSTWRRVIKYKDYDYYISRMYVPREFFIGLESADIPPEAE